MRKCFFLVLSLVFLTSFAEAQDSLWVKTVDTVNYIQYKLKSGDDLFSIAKQFKVPPAQLADFNNTNFTKGIFINKPFYIPIGPYNYNRNDKVQKSRILFYKVGRTENLRAVSRKFNLAQSQIQKWNNLNKPAVFENQILQVGWIAYEAPEKLILNNITKLDSEHITNSRTKQLDTMIAQSDDTLVADSSNIPVSTFEEEYNEQTNGFSLNSESGAAVFYPLKLAQEGSYYALSDLAKGTIIKVESPATGKVIYAKVIGELPKINKYNNAVIGLSGNAAKALSMNFNRFFCKISYR